MIYKNKFAMMLKTYIGDIKFAERLILSYLKYNKDNIKLYIVVSASEIEAFKKFKS